MTDIAPKREKPPVPSISQPVTAAAALAALGIVYGDLGTSPLYTLPTIVEAAGGRFSPEVGLGVLSLIFWALLVTVSVKYCLFVMRADNHGEGGILALMSLVAGRDYGRASALVAMGLFGAALIYGDGIITPAISVLSALEGVNIASDALKPYVMPLAVAILVVLFWVQHRGTARLGAVLGPLMLLWFTVIAVLGIGGIARHPAVLAAIDPLHGVRLLLAGGWKGFAILGGVFLAITGGEALYADMGHVGRNPVRVTWYLVVLPALLLNYAGQIALMIDDPLREGSPFFRLAPDWALYPLVVLATAATVVASQAIITGTFSLTRQAMQLGWFPGMHIRQTSDTEYGQIYVPFINWMLLLLTIALTVVFGSSDRLAGAYGTAVSTAMLLTTALLFRLMREQWRWSMPLAVAVSGVFLLVDFVFFAANLAKIAEGGWIPLTFGALVFVVMRTWRAGIVAMQSRQSQRAMTPDQFRAWLDGKELGRVPGTVVFLARTTGRIPPPMVRHIEHFAALPDTLIILTVSFDSIPRVPSGQRIMMTRLFEGLWEITAHYGFVEIPDLPVALAQAGAAGCPIDFAHAVFVGAPDRVIRDRRDPKLWAWQVALFAFLFRNAVHAVDLFRLPPDNYVEIVRQIEI